MNLLNFNFHKLSVMPFSARLKDRFVYAIFSPERLLMHSLIMAVSHLLWDKIKFAPRKYFSPSLELCLCLLPEHPVVFRHPLWNVNTRTGHAIPVCKRCASIRWVVPDGELKIIAVLAYWCIKGMNLFTHYITLANYVELFLYYEL